MNSCLLLRLILAATIATAAVMCYVILFIIDGTIILVTCLADWSFQHNSTYHSYLRRFGYPHFFQLYAK
jgi:hypothetical protein